MSPRAPSTILALPGLGLEVILDVGLGQTLPSGRPQDIGKPVLVLVIQLGHERALAAHRVVAGVAFQLVVVWFQAAPEAVATPPSIGGGLGKYHTHLPAGAAGAEESSL